MLTGPSSSSKSFERFVYQAMHAQVQAHEDVGLAREVVVESGLGEAHPLGQLPQRGVVEALFKEQVERLVQDPFSRAALTHRHDLT